jgi:CheY-like chemotaxis protein
MRLLTVDDHAAMRRLIGRVVNDLFNVIVECENGADALYAYERHQPDWVVTLTKGSATRGTRVTKEIQGQFFVLFID